jgi:hypothetical protein
MDSDTFLNEIKISVNATLNLAGNWILSGSSAENKKYLTEIRERMSESGGIIRNRGKVEESAKMAQSMVSLLPSAIGAGSVPELADAFQLMDNCITHFVYLRAISFYLENGGRSRGSYIVTDSAVPETGRTADLNLHPDLCQFDRDIENKIIEVGFKDGLINLKLQEIREIPKQDLWFERVWKDYLEDNYLDC